MKSEKPARLIVETTQGDFLAVQSILTTMGCKVTVEPQTVTIAKEEYDLLVRMAHKYYRMCPL